MVGGVWVVVAAAATVVGTGALVAYLRRYREEPGADWFLASLGCQLLWNAAYGVALLVFDPLVRWALEALMFGLLAGLSLFFVAFALEYTGRLRLDTAGTRWGVATVPVLTVAVAATNPLHGLVLTGYHVDPVAGLATVDYAFTPLSLVGGTFAVVAPVAGSVLLFDTVLSYGALYRREAVAVGLSTFPPAAGFVGWLYGLGPAPQLHLVVLGFLPHVALDGYAFVRGGMFEFHPATRRAGERAVIDDLGDPVVVVDERGRIVTLNAAAESLLGVDRTDALTTRVDAHLDAGTFDPTAGDQQVAVRTDGSRRTFAVTVTPLDDGDRTSGYALVWQDVTAEIRREQRLTVLNRVLRHNLRNDLGVVRGAVETVHEDVDDERAAGLLDTAVRNVDALLYVGESARDIERMLAAEPSPEPVALDDLLDGVVAAARDTNPDATVTLDCPPVSVVADRQTLEAVCEALVDNAVRHAGTAPTVTVSVVEHPDEVVVRVADDGPGVPETELAVVDSGTETDLQHGSGLGLWLIRWGSERLGADVAFETDETGTTVRLSLPRARE